MNPTRLLRIGLGYLAIVSAQIGIWALLAPRSFYDNFPGLGRAWVSVDGPYNEHLIRDVGALNLALVVLLVATAISPTKQLLRTTAVASLAWSVPHFLYHLANTGDLSVGDNALSLSGLGLFVLIGVALLLISKKPLEADTTDEI